MPGTKDRERSGADPELTIRRATRADAQAVTEITDLAYAQYVPLLGRKPQPMTADHSAMIIEDAVWLLLEGERVLGILELVAEPGCTLIYNVAVRPEHQKRGLGHRLLAWAESEALRLGHERTRLYTNGLMVDNIKLYKRLGYVETGREPYLGSTLVHMAKQVSGDPLPT